MTPLRRRVPVPVLGALLLAAVVVGCSPGEATEPSLEPTVAITVAPSPSEVSPTPAISTPDPIPSPTLDEEQRAAADTVLEFFRLKNVLSRDPESEVQPLADITTGQTQTIQMSTLAEDREAGIVQTGDDLYDITAIGEVKERGVSRVVSIEVCTDSSATDLIDQETGKSVLGPDRAYFVEWQIEVLQEGARWKVGDITSGRVDLCGPS